MIQLRGKHHIIEDLKKLQSFSKEYFLHPVEKIKTPPSIGWESAVVTVFAVNILYAILRAFYQISLINIIVGVLITPFAASILLLLTALFLYYLFQFTVQKTHDFNKITTVLLLAYLPGTLFFLGSAFYPPLFLLGMIVMSALVTVGFAENFQLPRKMIMSLVAIGFALALVFWIIDQVYGRSPIQPKSMDEMESEINENF